MAKQYEGFGESKSLKEWSKDERCPCCFNTLKSRIYYGYSIEEAFNLDKNKRKLFKAFGEEKSLRDWSVDHRCNCDYKTLYNRVVGKNWNVEKALSKAKSEFNRTSKVGEFIGEKINNIKILSRKNQQRNARRVLVNCQCLLCGNEFVADFSQVKTGRIKNCACVRKNKGVKSFGWQGYGEISKSLYSRIKTGAKKRGLEFSLTIEYLWELFLDQNGYCRLSGRKIKLPKTRRDYEATASLDRKDSEKGYTEENVQWVHKDVNYAKQQLSGKEFFNLCKDVYNNLKSHEE